MKAVKKKNQPLSRLQVVQAHQMFKDHTEEIGEGLYKYKDDWTDEKVADQLKCSIWVLRKLRAELGFKFERGNFLGITHAQADRIDSLERANMELTDRFNRLVETLALNRTADVKHLKIQ